MLLRFGVENHGSIASYQELQLTATALKDDDTGVMTAEGASADNARALRVLPVAGIYGANASGKSTVLRAIDFFVQAIAHSHSRMASRTGTPYDPYLLDAESRNKSSRYDADIVLGDTRYHYGFILDGKYILQEWLYSFDLTASRQARSVMFGRETSGEGAVEIVFPGKSLKGENKQIAKLVRPNSLFLSVAAQNAHPQITPIFEFFEQVVSRLNANLNEFFVVDQLTAYFALDEHRRDAALQFLRAADVGISSIDFSRIPFAEKDLQVLKGIEQLIRQHANMPEPEKGGMSSDLMKERVSVRLGRRGKDGEIYPIALDAESTGTQALLQVLGPVFAKLHAGGTILIDELNTALHPLVSRELIKLFQNPITNPGKAQLIFSTHDTNLLTGSLLRRDQVWFAEKDAQGCTHLYSLSDIKVRATDNIERGYLMGRFGATARGRPSNRAV
ncbi:ATP/GTP-binding protein [Bordetella sp. LUAb4]|uniref:AAA family ATPase n=1 Tax=Bordetella sp. LUAb4 TaxID=2843195 RepID=UPI001E5D9EE9|nr:ATP-binding protein [Bordetella sp. LUAb4]